MALNAEDLLTLDFAMDGEPFAQVAVVDLGEYEPVYDGEPFYYVSQDNAALLCSWFFMP